MTLAACEMPRGMAESAENGSTGWLATTWYVPGTTTVRPVAGS